MKIVCPSCQAQYEVPEVVLTSRRKMRCARCGSEWVPGDTHAPEPPLAVEPDTSIKSVAPEPEPAPAAEAIEVPPPVLVRGDDLAAMTEPDLSWAEPEPAHHLVAEPEPEPAVIDRVQPPSTPLAVRPDTPVGLRRTLPDPAAIVVPPVRPGPPVVEWVVSVALVAGLVVAGVMFRAPIMKAWPPSARAYAVVGLEK